MLVSGRFRVLLLRAASLCAAGGVLAGVVRRLSQSHLPAYRHLSTLLGDAAVARRIGIAGRHLGLPAILRVPRRTTHVAAWEDQRNAAGARVRWMFTTERARAKLARAYPDPAKES